MYFVVITAFALILSDELPPARLNLLAGRPPGDVGTVLMTLAIVFGQLAAVAVSGWYWQRRTRRLLDGTISGHDDATECFSKGQLFQLGLITASLIGTLLLTPWADIIRDRAFANLDVIPLLGDLLVIAPFFAALTLSWAVQYRAEAALRTEALRLPESDLDPGGTANPEAAALIHPDRPPPDRSLGTYLLDKYRHQVLVIAVPMALIVLAKHFTDMLREPLMRSTSLPWLADAILGTFSIGVLLITPMLLRYVWDTEPLPEGPLRERFVRTCARIGLRYREILVWHTHGMNVNAAVMGFIPPLRYILVSDGLLETMNEEEIEAVFGHEAGHVHHWHLPYFGAFAATSMYVSGGAMILLEWSRLVTDIGLLQLVGMSALLAVWLFGFGWLSRRFERQADLFGVRCVTPDVERCLDWCPVHGRTSADGLCVTATNLFGKTLGKIASLNGIPRSAPSWRHGSIESRCRLLESLASDAQSLRAFDRRLYRIKTVLFMTTMLGTLAAGLIYYDSVARAFGWPMLFVAG